MPQSSSRSRAVRGVGDAALRPVTKSKAPGDRRDPLSARVLYFGSAGPTPETRLAEDISGTIQLFRIADDYTAYVDDGRTFYNTVFVAGSDPVRIRKFMRIYRPLLKAKAKIALVRDSRPRARAQLLNTGFDDVFEMETPVPEALARIRAVLARLGQRHEKQVLEKVMDLHLQRYVTQDLLGREARLLSMLIAAQGAPVRTQQLATSSRSTQRPISIKSLQVLISGVRAKLKPHIRILSHGPSGYSLQDASPARSLIAQAAGRSGSGSNPGPT